MNLVIRARPLVNGSPSGFLRAPRARVGRRCASPRRCAPLLKIKNISPSDEPQNAKYKMFNEINNKISLELNISANSYKPNMMKPSTSLY